MSQVSCPCGSGQDYEVCCGRFISGEANAPTPESLMRSRFTAYVRADADYLLATWHESTRPPELHFNDGNHWFDLTVVSSDDSESDVEGRVKFEARFKHGDRMHTLKEHSRFVKEDGRWYYVDGVFDDEAAKAGSQKIGRNEPCPCGSGKKYKRCCG